MKGLKYQGFRIMIIKYIKYNLVFGDQNGNTAAVLERTLSRIQSCQLNNHSIIFAIPIAYTVHAIVMYAIYLRYLLCLCIVITLLYYQV